MGLRVVEEELDLLLYDGRLRRLELDVLDREGELRLLELSGKCSCRMRRPELREGERSSRDLYRLRDRYL